MSASDSERTDSQEFHTGGNHLTLPKIPIDYVHSNVHGDALDFKGALKLEKPVDELEAQLSVEALLLLHVVTAGVVLDLVIADLIVKHLDVFHGCECIRLSPEEKLGHRLRLEHLCLLPLC